MGRVGRRAHLDSRHTLFDDYRFQPTKNEVLNRGVDAHIRIGISLGVRVGGTTLIRVIRKSGCVVIFIILVIVIIIITMVVITMMIVLIMINIMLIIAIMLIKNRIAIIVVVAAAGR